MIAKSPVLRQTEQVGNARGPSNERSRFTSRSAEKLTDHWSPRVIAEVDNSYVKVAKVKGVLTWHSHDGEDELFFVLKGTLRIEMEDRDVTLNAGELFVVPKGVRHNPVADHECHILLFERKSTAHTGTVVTDKTRSIEEQLGSSS